jgi:hypothetical protein
VPRLRHGHFLPNPPKFFFLSIYLYLPTYLWLYNPCGPWSLFQFLNPHTVSRNPLTGDQPVARPLPIQRTPQTQNKRTDIHASSGIRTHGPAFERAKTFHALDRAATVIGIFFLLDARMSSYSRRYIVTGAHTLFQYKPKKCSVSILNTLGSELSWSIFGTFFYCTSTQTATLRQTGPHLISHSPCLTSKVEYNEKYTHHHETY